MKKKLVAAVAALVLALSLLPLNALAAESTGEELTKLGTPTELTWGKEVVYTGPDEYELRSAPGYMTWKTAEPDQNEADVKIYRVGADKPVYENSWSFGGSDMKTDEYRSVPNFIMADLDSGTYYFTVQSRGDRIQYADSDVARSENWEYTAPEARLPKPEAGTWDWPNSNWPEVTDEQFGSYEVEYLFSETADGEPARIGEVWGFETASNKILDSYIQSGGAGYYYFRVRAITKDVNAARNSEWSELSPAYNLEDVYAGIKDSLDGIKAEAGSEDAKTAVKELDRETLKSAMLADEGEEDGVIEKLKTLEGDPAAVEVEEEVKDFAAEKVSVVGANLNMAENETATLVLDRPSNEELKIPDEYDSTVAVKFDLHLEAGGEKYTEALAIPVQVTLPIPDTINPEFLTILHYGLDGNIETIYPYVFQEGGQWYAAIVLDHFSDFAMVEQKPKYFITVHNIEGAGGNIALGDGNLFQEPGAAVTLIVTPDEGYKVEAVNVVCDKDATALEVTLNSDGTYSFIMPESDVTVSAAFARIGGSETDSGYVPPVTPTPSVNKADAENGSFTVSDEEAGRGDTVKITPKADEGYVVDQVSVTGKDGNAVEVKDNGDGTYSFVMPKRSAQPVTVKVTFKEEAVEKGRPFEDFTDLDPDAWYHDSVDYVLRNGLMQGTGDATFGPGETTTRAQLVTILYRLEGEPAVTKDLPFADVPAGEWYSDAVNWAAANEIVNGITATQFGPGDPVTREQMATILYRYAEYKGYNVTGPADLSGYTDAGAVSDWAGGAMGWAVTEGIIQGDGGAVLDPSGASTRAQLAEVLMRFCEDSAE